MKKLLRVVVASCAALVVLGGAGVGYLVYRGIALDHEAKAFVDRAVPAIAAHWSEAALLERSAPELRQATKPEAMAAVFQRFSQYGPLVRYEGSKGEASAYYDVGKGGKISASFTAQVKCQNGEAVFRLKLLKRHGQWQILYLHVGPASPIDPNRPRRA